MVPLDRGHGQVQVRRNGDGRLGGGRLSVPLDSAGTFLAAISQYHNIEILKKDKLSICQGQDYDVRYFIECSLSVSSMRRVTQSIH